MECYQNLANLSLGQAQCFLARNLS